MTPAFCVCICNNAHWWLKDYGNDREQPRFYWSINPNEAHQFTRHEAAIAVMRVVKHAHPNEFVRLMAYPNEVHQ